MIRMPWSLSPQAATMVLATLAMLAVVLVASLAAAVAERLAQRPGRRAGTRCYYVGRHGRSGPAVFVVDSAVRPLAPGGPGPRRFGWGSVDQGGLDLARSLLRDATGADPAPAQTRRFAGEVVSGLPDDGFVLAAEHVQRWLSAQRRRDQRAGALT